MTVFGKHAAPRRPPRLLIRSLLVTFAVVLAILLAVFVMLVIDLRGRVRAEVADNLDTGRLLLSELQQRRLGEVQARLSALAVNPTMEAAIEKYRNRFSSFSVIEIRQSMVWLEGELQKMAEAAGADVAAIADLRGQTMAAAGRLAGQWPPRVLLAAPPEAVGVLEQALAAGGAAPYRVSSLPVRVGGEAVGTLHVVRRLDARYAADVGTITRADTVLFEHRAVLASTLPPWAARRLATSWPGDGPERGEVELAGEKYAFQQLERVQGTSVYALSSVSLPASRTTAKAFRALVLAGLVALALSFAGSLFLARTLASPIDAITRELSAAVRTRDFGVRLESDGSSREIEVLSETFNELMASLSRAEDERRSAYVEAIQALAKALEARDGYTAGHSERVGDLSARIAGRMGMSREEIEVLRLGASLHDIGKIGIRDGVLRKNGPLTDAERIAIQAHPLLGARILQPVAFLADHLPIVELHHERPDGRGYPHGLTREQIPLAAHIVHVADAFDAMTSDRPYRGSREMAVALDEIRRCRGTQFDEAVVDAFLELMVEDERINAACQA